MEWEDVSVFISSTFNDMHAERDYLVKSVFPHLGEWCERKHIFLRDIDLRWGVSRKDSETRNTIYRCLTAVDSCRPFFLCILGQRRGWVPTLDDISSRTRESFPEIVGMADSEKYSATEYEIEHALLMPLAWFENGVLHRKEPVRNALFLRRRPDYVKELSAEQRRVFLDYREDLCRTPESYAEYLETCRKANQVTYDRIAEHNLVLDYDCRWDRDSFTPELLEEGVDDGRAQGRLTDFSIRAEDLPEDLRSELLSILEKEFPGEVPEGGIWPLKAYLLAEYARQFLPYAAAEHAENDRYAQDREQQEVFRKTCLRDAVRRRDITDQIRAYCDGGSDRPLLVLADAGMGKTTLMSEFADEHRDLPMIARFLGVSERSGDILPLWDSIFHEAGQPSPPDIESLRTRLPDALAAMAPRVLLLDGLEQIPGGLEMAELIPSSLPEGIKVIVSVRSDYRKEELERLVAFHRDYQVIRISPFTAEQKKELIQSTLRTSLKELSEEMTERICGLNESGNPLYLSILLHDIRSFGSFPQLQSEILRHGGTPFSAADAMLERMENDRLFYMLSPEICVPLVFGLLAHARDGLSGRELTECIHGYFPGAGYEECEGSIRICLRQVRPFISRRDGRTDFRHQAFRDAAQARYAMRAEEFHTVLSGMFRRICDPEEDGSFRIRDPRALREYAWQLSFVSEERYAGLYSDVAYLNARCEAEYVRDLIREYDDPRLQAVSPSEKAPADMRDLLVRYREVLEQYPNMLPSLVWAYGSGALRGGEDFGRLCCAWLRAEPASAAPGGPLPEQSPDTDGTAHTGISASAASGIRIMGETLLQAAAFCLDARSGLAFAFTGQGQVTAYELETMLPLANPIYTSKSMPLGLCAVDGMLAAAFENGNLELYAYEADGSTLRSRPAGTLGYLPPLYSGAAMAFDSKGRLWFQQEEYAAARYDPAGGECGSWPVPQAEEISSICTAEGQVYGTACAGMGTLLFGIDDAGTVTVRDLGNGDSRVLCADQAGCIVSCAASNGVYPLLLVDAKLETIREDRMKSPVAAALSRGMEYVLLPAMQSVRELWIWNGEITGRIGQELKFQDQADLCTLDDGSVVMASAVAVTRFVFEGGEQSGGRVREETAGSAIRDIPDLSPYELTDTRLYAQGDFACAAGVSASMKSVRDEQCAGAVFLEKRTGTWHVAGDRTWPRSLELIRTVCIDPAGGRFTLLFRSEENLDTLYALQGTAEEICSGTAFARELALPQNRENHGCCAGGRTFISSGNLLLVYRSEDLEYETGVVLPAEAAALHPDEKGVILQYGGQERKIRVQERRGS